mmetsp:Transcript_52576/g.139583  ORF Transcript_52576/g.139583 Transcript_52576/m.139583 type:complete len:226 (-) Transcript_52576:1488-2165(-)
MPRKGCPVWRVNPPCAQLCRRKSRLPKCARQLLKSLSVPHAVAHGRPVLPAIWFTGCEPTVRRCLTMWICRLDMRELWRSSRGRGWFPALFLYGFLKRRGSRAQVTRQRVMRWSRNGVLPILYLSLTWSVLQRYWLQISQPEGIRLSGPTWHRCSIAPGQTFSHGQRGCETWCDTRRLLQQQGSWKWLKPCSLSCCVVSVSQLPARNSGGSWARCFDEPFQESTV